MSELYEDPTDEPVVSSPQTVVVVSNFPDADTARSVAEAVVREKLAACVNVMSPCHSVYSWGGELQQGMEVPVWFKTTDRAATRLMEQLKRIHPHDVPELLVLRPHAVQTDYAQWVQRSVG